MSEITVHHGDSREVLKTVADASIDSCVTDPPYALVSIGKRFGKDGAAPCKAGKTGAYQRASVGFMGQKWDTGETAFDPEFWAEVLRVLKPGAHLLAFSGTRTYHRMVCAIEDAGFEIRDQIGWAFGSGFPKSHDVSKGIDRAAGVEREIVGVAGKGGATRNSMAGDFAGGEYMKSAAATPEAAKWQGWGTALKPAWEPICVARKPLDGTVAANVLQHSTGALNIDGCRVGARGKPKITDPKRTSNTYGAIDSPGGKLLPDARWPANLIHDGSDEVVACFPETNGQIGGNNDPGGSMGHHGGARGISAPGVKDYGSAARFFYTAKADAEDRLGSKHPTVKPVDLMAYLCRLVTPPGGTVLDPFSGTGTTGLAAMREGFDCILIEREENYVADINRRLEWARGNGGLTAQEKRRKQEPMNEGLFADFDS